MKTIKERIIDILDKQNQKGVNTYGITLDEQSKEYDWQHMIIEELIDALQYSQKETIRLQKENAALQEENVNLTIENLVLKGVLK